MGNQVMAYLLFLASLLPEPVMNYCRIDPKEWMSVKSQSKYNKFHSRKFIWKCCLQNGGHFVSTSVCWSYLLVSFWCSGTVKMLRTHKKLRNLHGQVGLNSLSLGWGNITCYKLSSKFVSCHRNCAKKKHGWNIGAKAVLDIHSYLTTPC